MPPPCSRCGATTRAGADALCAACLLRLAALPEALAPDYEIETLLGSGPAGTTYLARDASGGALLAVKILTVRDEAQDAPEVTDALRGALTSFRHPSVAKTHAVDVDADGNVRLVRDYIAGKPLAGWAAQADPASRRQAFETITAALDAVHAAGLFHGHVAATNIVIGASGRPVLVDVGAGMALRALEGVAVPVARMSGEDRGALQALRTLLGEPP